MFGPPLAAAALRWIVAHHAILAECDFALCQSQIKISAHSAADEVRSFFSRLTYT